MARKKILFVIVEGPSDDAALGVILNRLYDKSNNTYVFAGESDADRNAVVFSLKPAAAE